MPSSGDPTKHQKEGANSDEFHHRLASIIERFEETRLAIRENVKMLEAIQDTSSTLDSVYPGSSSSRDNKCLDMASGTGHSFGHRTISSIDSGVMLTMTSCSELGTQSRNRSFDSWTGLSSPCTSLPYKIEEIDGNGTDSSETLDSDASEESNSNSDCSDSEEAENDYSDVEHQSEKSMNGMHLVRQDAQDLSDSDYSQPNGPIKIQAQIHMQAPLMDVYTQNFTQVHGRFETQEHSISFENNDYLDRSDGYYQPPQRNIVPERRENIVYKSSVKVNSDTPAPVRSYSNPERSTDCSARCIVLPPAEAKNKLNRPKSLDLSHLPTVTEEASWMEYDHFNIQTPQEQPKPQRNTSQEKNHSSMEKSNSFQLIFSPIPEESSSDYQSPSLATRRGQYLQNGANNSRQHTKSEKVPLRKKISSSTDEGGVQPKKARRKKKKASSPTKRSPTSPEQLLASSTTSTTSSPSQNSDRSHVSYKNAIQNHRIPLPQDKPALVQGAAQRSSAQIAKFSIDSSSSSGSSVSCHNGRFTSSSSSSSSDEMSEPSLVHYANHNLKKLPIGKSEDTKVLSLFKKNKESSLKAKPPVIKKVVKDPGKQAPSAPGPKPTQSTSKGRLFQKNSETSIRKKKLLKSKSDEASNSLLRYFRFPSPPRAAAAEHKDSSEDKENYNPMPTQQMQKDTAAVSRSAGDEPVAQISSTCSCCSSSSDTSSETAYPGLHIDRSKYKLHQKPVNSNAGPTLIGPPPVPISPQILSPQQLERHRVTEQSTPYNKPPTVAQVDPVTSGYTLYLPETSKKSQKKRKCGLFQRLFGRAKSTEGRIESSKPKGSKLMLDLAGGEVRLKQEEPKREPPRMQIQSIPQEVGKEFIYHKPAPVVTQQISRPQRIASPLSLSSTDLRYNQPVYYRPYQPPLQPPPQQIYRQRVRQISASADQQYYYQSRSGLIPYQHPVIYQRQASSVSGYHMMPRRIEAPMMTQRSASTRYTHSTIDSCHSEPRYYINEYGEAIAVRPSLQKYKLRQLL